VNLFSIEEFAARRRLTQNSVEEKLRPLVRRGIDRHTNTHGWQELTREIGHVWREVYIEETGEDAPPIPASFRREVYQTLIKTDRQELKEHERLTEDRIIVWMATAILGSVGQEFAKTRPGEVLLEWVTMHDDHVRAQHRRTDGQRRPVGEPFDVEGHPMRFPGDSTAPIELWINCRCALRPVVATEAARTSGEGIVSMAASDNRKSAVVVALPKADHPVHKMGSEQKHTTLTYLDNPDQATVDALHKTTEHLGKTYGPITAKVAGRATLGPDKADTLLVESHDFNALKGGIEQDPAVAGHLKKQDTYPHFVPHMTLGYPGDTQAAGGEGDPADVTEIPYDRLAVWHGDKQTEYPLAGDTVTASNEFRDVGSQERKNLKDKGHAMPDGSFPIANCSDLRNARQAVGRAKDPEAAKRHIAKRARELNCGEEAAMTDEIDDLSTYEMSGEPLPAEPSSIPWHGVLAPEGIASGDGRMFAAGALRFRPLPLPLTFQKKSASGHDGNVTVAKIDRIERVNGEMRGTGTMLSTPEADEVVGLLGEFGRFGVSIDADDAKFEMSEDEQNVVFTDARISAACIVSIPAFAEAWVSLGEAPGDFFDGGEEVAIDGDPEAIAAAGALAEFVDVAPGRTEDGPGWLTHPVDTDRLRDYWTHGAGAAKIAWGSPGDFNRCRVNVAKYVKPQYLNGYCANRHYDALGFWPGRPVSGETVAFDSEGNQKAAPALTLVAGAERRAPAAWFKDPQFAKDDGRMVLSVNEQEDGTKVETWGCPLTITDEGQVYGHIALWDTCHTSFSGVCITPPMSSSGYAYFQTGAVLTDEGDVPVGQISLGGGHADVKMGWRPAAAHYDSTSAAVADVAVGEDEFGIWFSGWVRPGTPEEMVAALRASGLSGDWRAIRAGGNLELIAALAVNVQGFPVPRTTAASSNGEQVALVASGMVKRPETEKPMDTEALAERVAVHLGQIAARREKMAALAARVKKDGN